MVPSSLPTQSFLLVRGNGEALGGFAHRDQSVSPTWGGVGGWRGGAPGTVTGFTSMRSKTLMVPEPAFEATTLRPSFETHTRWVLSCPVPSTVSTCRVAGFRVPKAFDPSAVNQRVSL